MIKYIIRNIRFFFKDIFKNILKALFSSFGIIFLIAFMVIYISLRQSVSQYLGSTLFGSMDINDIIINPGARLGNEVMVTRENTISAGNVAKIRQMPELSNVYSLIRMSYVTRIETAVLDRNQTVRIPIYGIEQGFFKGKTQQWQTFRNKTPLPLVFPKFGLQFLNTYLAQEGLPQFKEKDMVGYPGILKISVDINEDEYKRYETPLVLHSLSDVFDFPGVIIPSDFITNFSKRHRMDSGKPFEGYTYIRLYAKVKDIKQLPEITAKLQKMGLKVESRSDISQKTNKAMDIIDSMFLLVGLVLLMLTVISIFNSYLVISYNSAYDISLKRVIGLSKMRVILTFVIEAALIGALLGVIGYFLGQYLMDHFSSKIGEWIPAFKDLIFVKTDKSYLPQAIIFSVVVSAASALIPAIAASNKNLFKTMAQ